MPRMEIANAAAVSRMSVQSRTFLLGMKPSLWKLVKTPASNCFSSSVWRVTEPVTVET